MNPDELKREIERRDEVLAYDKERIAELEAQCTTMREARVAALEEAAKVAERCTCAAINPSWEAAQEAIAAAIRELKEKP